MDWTLAIERNTMALKSIVATLVAMARLGAASTSPLRGEVAPQSGAGGGDDAAQPTLPRRLHRAILRLLRPAESAVRRLIVVAARGLVVPPSAARPAKPKQPSIFVRTRGGTGIILPRGAMAKPPRPAPLSISLPLFDRMKRPFERRRPTQVCAPRISYPGPFNRLSPVKVRLPPTPDDPLDATRLTLRIQALTAALDDLPGQARRLARWCANRDAAKSRDRAAEAALLAPLGVQRTGETRGSPRHGTERSEGVRGPAPTSQNKAPRRYGRLSPLRPGRPPGFNRRLDADMRDMLTNLHGLARGVLEHPDTS